MKKFIDQITDEINRTVDGLGLDIDPKIKKAVIACNFAGFKTSQSCEGHMEKWGTPYPWVEIDGLKSIPLMKNLIDEFYQTHKKDKNHIRIVAGGNYYRLQFKNKLPTRSSVPHFKRNLNYLLKTRSEMNKFAKFLIQKY